MIIDGIISFSKIVTVLGSNSGLLDPDLGSLPTELQADFPNNVN